MVVKKLFESPQFPYHMVVETMDGRYMGFYATPCRRIAEKDLSPLPRYQVEGNNNIEATQYFYCLYGLEKRDEA